ncbi:DUF6538 domain-containing protein [Sphingobium sp.]|uniref:DUF6538 domain-containing protein n=1 Tax=Sphingobium sp. TaxID=1912891 RepID=UPI003B3BBE9E
MCSYLHKAPNGVYYFRMGIPADLRPFMGGKREIKMSLGLKDRDAAKLIIPDHTKAAHTLLDQARRDKAAAEKPASKPRRPKVEPVIWESDPASEDQESEIEALEPIMDAMMEGRSVDASPADILRAGQLLALHEREMAAIEQEQLVGRMLGRASAMQNQVVDCEGDTPAGKGKGVYLDTDIVDGWAAERKPSPRGKDAYWRDAKLFNSMIGRKSVEQITKADVMTYKRMLIADPKRSQINVRDRLAYLRTLLEWAAQEDIVPVNVARDVKMAVSERGEKRKDFSIDDLNALFSGPVYTADRRSKAGYGEAAYWMPLIALFMGARREEIGQLRVSDVKRVAYIDAAEQRQEAWCIDITDIGDDDALPNQIKNEASRRLVPLHPKLIEMGFVDYVAKLPDQAGRVFPALQPIGIGMKLTDKWGQWFSRYKRACGIDDKAKVFHSFRHTWKTHAVDAGMPERVCRQFQGHEGKDAADKYGAAPSMRVLVDAIASFRIPGLKLPMPQG